MARVTEHRDCTRPAGPGSHVVVVACLCLQMVWESGCVVIVMLTPLSENGVRQCYHYWPDEGSNLYHVYEVHPRGPEPPRWSRAPPQEGGQAGVPRPPQSMDPQTFQTAVRWHPGLWHKL